MKPAPMVTVVMITYNHENFIQKAIEGVLLQQCDFDIELLIADDCSIDNTRKVVHKIIVEHSKGNCINYNKHIINKGMMPNFIWALKQPKSKYIAICEGDDYWTDPLKLQKQVDFLEENPDYVLTYHDFVRVRDSSTETNKSNLSESDRQDCSDEDLILYRKWIKPLTMCFKNVISDFPKEMLSVKNGDMFVLSLLGNHGKGKWMGDEIEPGIYREHQGGVWSSIGTQKRNIDFINTYYWIFQYYARVKNVEIAKSWFDKMINHLYKIEGTTLNESESIFNLYERQNREMAMLKNGMPYKIGRIITSPIRLLKSLTH